MERDDPPSMRLETCLIPGGRYARRKIKDWENNIEMIGPTFESMAKEYGVDPYCLSIEFYKSQNELILLLPIEFE